jgi:hypothetical protein
VVQEHPRLTALSASSSGECIIQEPPLQNEHVLHKLHGEIKECHNPQQKQKSTNTTCLVHSICTEGVIINGSTKNNQKVLRCGNN